MKWTVATLCLLVILVSTAFRARPAAPTVYVLRETVAINQAGGWRADKTMNCNSGDFAVNWGYSISNGEWGVLQAVPSLDGRGYQFRVQNHDEFIPYEFTVGLYLTCMKFQ